jgi:hypothetical protein
MTRSLIIGAVLSALLASAVYPQTLTGKVGREYTIYQRKAGFKAFAWNGADAYSYTWGSSKAEYAVDLALKSCEENRKALPNKTKNTAPCEIIHQAGPE